MTASGTSAIMLRNGRSAAVPAVTLGDAVGTPSPVSKRPVANSGFPFGSSSLIGCLLRTGSLLCPLSSVNGQLRIDPCPELLRRYPTFLQLLDLKEYFILTKSCKFNNLKK